MATLLWKNIVSVEQTITDKNQDEKKKRSFWVKITTVAVAIGAVFASPFGLRWSAADRILIDRGFAEKFKDGSFTYLHDKFGKDYIRQTRYQEKISEWWKDLKESTITQWNTQKELKEKGVSWSDSWKGQTSWEKIGLLLLVPMAAFYLYDHFGKDSRKHQTREDASFSGHIGAKEQLSQIEDIHRKQIEKIHKKYADGTFTPGQFEAFPKSYTERLDKQRQEIQENSEAPTPALT